MEWLGVVVFFGAIALGFNLIVNGRNAFSPRNKSHTSRDGPKQSEASNIGHSWRDTNSWAELKIVRAAGLVAMWVLGGLFSLVARVIHRRLVERRARRLGKGGPDPRRN